MQRRYWVELCAGSCAMSAALLGYGRRPTSWLGSKWGYRDQLAAAARARGLAEDPVCLVYDPHPIVGVASRLMTSQRARGMAADLALEMLGPLALGTRRSAGQVARGAEGDEMKARCRALEGLPPDDPDERAAVGAVMVGASFGGKGFHVAEGGRWVYSNGLGRSPGSLRAMRSMRSWHGVEPGRVRAMQRASATPDDLPHGVDPSDCVVLLDPPYSGRSGYPGTPGMERSEVVSLATAWAAAGAVVMLTEAEPVMHWPAVPLTRLARSASALSVPEILQVSK